MLVSASAYNLELYAQKGTTFDSPPSQAATTRHSLTQSIQLMDGCAWLEQDGFRVAWLDDEQVDDENTQVKLAFQAHYEPIDLTLFEDSIHHWQMKDGRDRNDQRVRPDQVVHIAENFLKFQNTDGGWPANLDWLAMIDVEKLKKFTLWSFFADAEMALHKRKYQFGAACFGAGEISMNLTLNAE